MGGKFPVLKNKKISSELPCEHDLAQALPFHLLLCLLDSYSPCRAQLRGPLLSEHYADPTLQAETTDPSTGLDR